MKNKIGWCSSTWNPVVGCKNNCGYCYARNFNTRFRFIKFWNEPEWREDSFEKKFPKKPQRIFVGSMSEVKYWELEWIQKVLDKIEKYPQHVFQFLTKFPCIYSQWHFPDNCWLGITITKEEDFTKGIPYNFICSKNITFLSIEPMLEKIDPNLFSELNINWVIIGAETGNRKGKVIPKKQWIWDMVNYCQTNNIPVYVKDSIGKLYSQFGGIKEFPEEKIR